jgi:hypothetical protein
MVIVGSIYLRFYIKVGVSTFLPTLTPPKIPSDSDSTALDVRERRKLSAAVISVPYLTGHQA